MPDIAIDHAREALHKLLDKIPAQDMPLGRKNSLSRW
jgi:hypothetical protein